ncbi:TPA: DUF2586 domain-containing protein [Klebsiella oxytoca]
MTWPTVDINQINQYQGAITEIERTMLLVGAAGANAGDKNPLTVVNAQTDLDSELGHVSPVLLEQVRAAQVNGGQGWGAYVLAIDPATAKPAEWPTAIGLALSDVSVEGVLVCSDVDDATTGRKLINDLQALRASLISSLGRRVWFIVTVAGAAAKKQTWADYRTWLNTLQKDVAANAVMLVPSLWMNEAGALAGRLCNAAVTVADSPMRVATGELLGLGIDSSDKPVDADGVEISLAYLQAFHDLRYSVPAWHPDYEGVYWSDGLLLEVKGGDYSVIEHLRVLDKAARRVRLRAIPKIADRGLNNTEASIERHKTYFAAPLREMSRSVQIGITTFPGDIEPPQEGDITITWLTREHVVIGVSAKPYTCPKKITINIALDLSLED